MPHSPTQLLDDMAAAKAKPRINVRLLATTGREPVVRVEHLAKTYSSGAQAVKGIDFEIERGEVFGLLGPNGAGKSTTIGMLTTTVAPSAGTARLAGFDVAHDPIAARSVSAVVFQDTVVDRGLTGRRNLLIHARLWGLGALEAKARIAETIESFGLISLADRSVSTYSGGERRRLEIARALISRPRVLFLDEPTVGLDPRIRYELLDLIAGLRTETEMTILLTTHYLDEAERLCDRVAIMHDGRIVALDTPNMLLASLGRELLELHVPRDAETALREMRAEGIAGADAFAVGSTITVPLHDASAPEALAALRGLHLPAAAISTRTPTLDDVYLRLTGARLVP